MSSQSSEKSTSRDRDMDSEMGENQQQQHQPIKVKFSLSGIMNSTSHATGISGIGNMGMNRDRGGRNEHSGGIGSGLGLGLGRGLGLGLGLGSGLSSRTTGIDDLQNVTRAGAANNDARDRPTPMGVNYDVDMEDGEEEEGEEDEDELEEEGSMESAASTSASTPAPAHTTTSASASASLTRNDAQDPDSNTETESNILLKPDGHGEDDMDVDMDARSESIADDDKSREGDKEQSTRTRATRSSSIDDQALAGMGGGGSAGGSAATGEESTSNHSGSTSKKKDDSGHGHGHGHENEMTSRSAAAAAERELLGFREPSTSVTAPTTSFLDSLSEEQRRVRTRHLPDVSGFRRLHKAEIKRDLAQVRKLLKGGTSSSSSSSAKAAGSGSSKKSEDDIEKDMEMDKMMGGDGNGVSEDDSQNYSPDDDNHVPAVRFKPGRGHMNDLDLTKILENPNLPNIFSLPYTESPYICTDVEGKSSSSAANNNNNNAHPSLFSSPQVVESITAFNPPRPPESVGPKKIHRLNRWERRPQDVEIDLSNYRKTVDRTRQELEKAENENYKVEVVGQHLRAHFMTQSQLMRHEADLLNETYESTRKLCMKGAELLTSKTRSRGTAKGANVMKDVLSVLKARKDRVHGENSDSTTAIEGESWFSSGVGGVSNNKSAPQLASGWLLSGERVSTPCGNGTVVHTFGPTMLDVNHELPDCLKKTSSHRNPPQSQLPSSMKDKKEGATIILPPRICVKLPFGLGYFCPSDLKSLENVAAYNDDQLSKRWMSMIQVSEMMGTTIDSAAVDDYDSCQSVVPSSSSNVGDMPNASIVPDAVMGNDESSQKTGESSGKLLPYGSSLLPSSSNRGGGLEAMPLEDLEENIGKMLDNSTGILGRYNNPNVPSEYKQWEVNRENMRRLQGKVMQLRNKVYRQKRIRFLNERSCASGEDRRRRFEALLSDMKSDLDSLKGRLKEELNELGIDQVKACELLSDYLASEDQDVDLDYSDGKRKTEEDFEKSSRRKLDMGPLSSSLQSEQ